MSGRPRLGTRGKEQGTRQAKAAPHIFPSARSTLNKTSNNTTKAQYLCFFISPHLADKMSVTKAGKLTIYIDCGESHHTSHRRSLN